MLMRTKRNIAVIFGLIFLSIIGYTVFYTINKPPFVSPNHKFVEKVSFFQTHGNKNSIMVVNWNILLKKNVASDKKNFTIEQVKPEGRNWVPVPNGKKITIGDIQYVYAPWVDTEEKRKNADPSEREKRITQLFVYIEPREELKDYFKITVRNMETATGEKMVDEEYGIINITEFNRLIKM